MLFDLEGMIRIEIVNPPQSHGDYLKEEFHFLKSRPIVENQPDVRIIFRESMKYDQSQVTVVEAPVGYDSEGVFFFDPNHEMVRIDFANFDKGTTVLKVSPDFNQHFLYIIVLYLISFKAILHGAVFCHASAVNYRGKTMLFPAWRHTGKTNLMLALLKAGGELIADDGVLLFENGEILSYSKRIHLLYFNFLANPNLYTKIDTATKSLLGFVENTRNGIYDISEGTIEVIKKLIRVRLPNSEISGIEHKPIRYNCDVIINLNKNLGSVPSKTTLVPIELGQLATKMTGSTIFELSHFLTAYHAQALSEANVVSSLSNSSILINGIITEGLSMVSNHMELSFHEHIDTDLAITLIDRYLNES